MGTVIGCIVNHVVLNQVIDAKLPYLDGTLVDPTGQVSLVAIVPLKRSGSQENHICLSVEWPKTSHFLQCISVSLRSSFADSMTNLLIPHCVASGD